MKLSKRIKIKSKIQDRAVEIYLTKDLVDIEEATELAFDELLTSKQVVDLFCGVNGSKNSYIKQLANELKDSLGVK